MAWIAHRVVSAIIHSVIYGFVFKAMHHLTMSEAAVLVVAVGRSLHVGSVAGSAQMVTR